MQFTDTAVVAGEVRALVAMDRELLDAIAQQRRQGRAGDSLSANDTKLFMRLFGKR